MPVNTRSSAIRYLRLGLGFLIAPVSVGLFFALLEVATGGYLAWWYIRMAAILGYPAALIFGLPLYFFVLERKGWRRLSAYALSGAAIGLAAFLIPYIHGYIRTGSTKDLVYAVDYLGGFAFLGIAFGTISACVFWVIAIRSAEY
jgi:hypothetical protein